MGYMQENTEEETETDNTQEINEETEIPEGDIKKVNEDDKDEDGWSVSRFHEDS